MSKIFASASYPKTSSAGYSVLSAICTVLIASFILLFFRKNNDNTPKNSAKNVAVCAAQGIINRLANFILVAALLHVDASIQYPMVTGGVMIVSTALAFFARLSQAKEKYYRLLLPF